MAEKITVAELDLDTDAFLAAATSTKSAILNLKDANKKLDTTRIEGRKQLVKNEVALTKLNKTYAEQKKVLTALTDETRDFTTAEKAATAAVDKQNKSIAAARKNNTDLNKIRNQLNLTTKEGRKQLDLINKKLDQNNKFIKENVDQYTQQKINIGNYGSALANTNPILGRAIGLMTQIKDALVAQKGAMLASTAATGGMSKALKIFKLALISTGIGALVVALGSLVAWLTSTQEGMDKVSKVMAQMGAAIDVVVDRIIQVGGAFAKLLDGDFEGALNDITGAFAGMGDEMEREIELAGQLADATADLRDAEIGEIVALAERRKEIAKQRILSKDESLTLEERIAALDKALALENENLQVQKRFAVERARIAQAEFDRATSDAKDLEELNLAKAAVFEIEAASLKKQESVFTQREAFVKRLRAEEIKIENERVKDAEKRLSDEEKEAEKKTADEQKELDRLQNFENQKRELQNEIDLFNAETQLEKEILKAEQDLEKKTMALEQMTLDAEERTELLALLTENEEQVIAAIREKWAKKSASVQILVDKKVLASEQKHAQARAQVASALTGVLIGILGDGLGAKLAAVAIDAAIQAGLVQITASSAMAQNTAVALSYGPPQNIAFAAAALGQNVLLQSAATAAIGQILTSAALSGLGTIAGSALSGKGFYEGGMIDSGASIPSSLRNSGGDDVLIQAKRGEVVLNESQQRRAGGDGFFSSIGVPGFAAGGVVDNNLNTSLQTDAPEGGELVEALQQMRVVAIVDDIREGVNTVVEIEDGANI